MANPISRAFKWLGQWFSTAEKLPDIGRNDPCRCGSGKKYKHCHMAEDRRRGTLTRNQAPNMEKQIAKRPEIKTRRH